MTEVITYWSPVYCWSLEPSGVIIQQHHLLADERYCWWNMVYGESHNYEEISRMDEWIGRQADRQTERQTVRQIYILTMLLVYIMCMMHYVHDSFLPFLFSVNVYRNDLWSLKAERSICFINTEMHALIYSMCYTCFYSSALLDNEGFIMLMMF